MRCGHQGACEVMPTARDSVTVSRKEQNMLCNAGSWPTIPRHALPHVTPHPQFASPLSSSFSLWKTCSLSASSASSWEGSRALQGRSPQSLQGHRLLLLQELEGTGVTFSFSQPEKGTQSRRRATRPLHHHMPPSQPWDHCPKPSDNSHVGSGRRHRSPAL